MNLTLLQREIKYSLKILLIFCGVLTLYTAMIISMFDPKLGESLEMIKESMPEMFALVGMDAPGTTLLDFINNYLFSFLYKVFPVVFFAFLVNRVLIRYIDRGTMAYLLSTSNSRKKIAFTQAGVILIQLLLLMVYVAILTIIVCESSFKGELDIPSYLLVMAGLYGLLMFLSGVCYLSGCIFNESGKAFGIGIGLNVLFILLQMISQAGDKFEDLKYLTPLTLFSPEKIASGGAEGIVMFLILYAGGIIFYGAGIYIFNKKDLSL